MPELFKNVTSWMLVMKTPKRVVLQPGQVIDLEMFGDVNALQGTSVFDFVQKGYLSRVGASAVKPKPKAEAPKAPAKPPATFAKKADDKTTTVIASRPEEPVAEMKPQKAKLTVENKTITATSPMSLPDELRNPSYDPASITTDGGAVSIQAPSDPPVEKQGMPPLVEGLPEEIKLKFAEVQAAVKEGKKRGPKAEKGAKAGKAVKATK